MDSAVPAVLAAIASFVVLLPVHALLFCPHGGEWQRQKPTCTVNRYWSKDLIVADKNGGEINEACVLGRKNGGSKEGNDNCGFEYFGIACCCMCRAEKGPSMYEADELLDRIKDELLWAAAWLYQATNNQYYLNYLGENGDSMGGTGWSMTEFGWDVKYAGVQTLVFKFLMQGRAGKHNSVFEGYRERAESFLCSCLRKGTRNVQTTPGGLLFRQRWNNMQFVTSASFLATVYSDYLASSGSFSRTLFIRPFSGFSFSSNASQ